MHILVVTGASGAGKTVAVQALERRELPGVRCFYFDSIGVPSAEDMARAFGRGESWQAWATDEWLQWLHGLGAETRVAVLDAQTRPSHVLGPRAKGGARTTHVVLLDCSSEIRDARLRGPRAQPELASARMDSWAAYLRGQADALDLPVIDTTLLSVAEVADRLERIARAL
jgi:hypothetical protein